MSKRIVKHSVMIQREGQLIYPPVGQEFDFTPSEITEINKQNKKALGLIVETDAPAAPAPKTKTEVKVA